MALRLSELDGSNGFRLDGVAPSDFSGDSVSGAGDVNGDGFDDLIIGAPRADTAGGYDAGASYVVFGNTAGFAASFDLAALDGSNGFRLDGSAYDDASGTSVSAAGDVNGDRIDDLIVGAPYVNGFGGSYAPGASYVVFGTGAGFPATLELGALDGTDGFRLDGDGDSGSSVSGAGDVNGDGIDDLIVGAPKAYGTDFFSGASYVVFGTNAGFPPSLDLAALDGNNGFRLDGPANDGFTGSSAGSSVSGAGDVNGDGFDDLFVGSDYGGGYVVFGTDAVFATSLDLAAFDGSDGFRLNGVVSGDGSCYSVSDAGDVNGDGIDDMIVGAANDHVIDNVFVGGSYVAFGSDAGFGPRLDLATLDSSNGFRLDGAGASVSGAGDFNGDGFDDLIVGGSDYPPGSHVGASYVVFGSDAGFAASIDLGTLDGSEGFRLVGSAGESSGFSVSGAGDINGDGFDDLIVGAPSADTAGGHYAGASYVVFGFRTGAADVAEASVAASPDDAEQIGGRVDLASKDLDIGCTIVGLRFTGIEVPEGATITSAHIEFQARLTGGCPADLKIAIEDTGDAASFGFGGSDIAGRDYLNQTTDWSPEAWVKGETYQTADLAAMLAALVGTGGIEADDALGFRLSGTGERTAWSFDGQGEAPRLVIEYESAGASLDTLEGVTVETDDQAGGIDLADTPAWSDLVLA